MSRDGTGNPMWILTIALLFARTVTRADRWLGECGKWNQTSVSTCAGQPKSGPRPIVPLHPRRANGIISWHRISPAARSKAVRSPYPPDCTTPAHWRAGFFPALTALTRSTIWLFVGGRHKTLIQKQKTLQTKIALGKPSLPSARNLTLLNNSGSSRTK